MTELQCTVTPTEAQTKPAKPRNVYIVWTEEYYRIIVAHSHSGAKFIYAREDGWENE